MLGQYERILNQRTLVSFLFSTIPGAAAAYEGAAAAYEGAAAAYEGAAAAYAGSVKIRLSFSPICLKLSFG